MILFIVAILFLNGCFLTILGEKKKKKKQSILLFIGYISFLLAAIIPMIEIFKFFN